MEAAGQRDPLVQYKRQSYEMFSGLMERIHHDVVHMIFRVALSQQPEPRQRERRMEARRPAAAGVAARASALAGQGTAVSAVAERHGGRSAAGSGKQKIGRNDPCPCGSGKKYKRCCGR